MTISARRLLVVDDDHDFAESLADLLELSGYEVEVVHSGEDAIRRCDETEFDLALMDVRMPGKDGVESFMEIRKSKPDFRAVLMTAYSMPSLLARALAQGARAAVRKPLFPERLIELIEKHRQRSLILVVDDDPDFADSLETTLQDDGYAVTVAADGEIALEKIAASQPAAILLDLRLPKTSGLEVFRELERRDSQAAVVVVSAYLADEADALNELRGRDLAGILQKPFAPKDLLSILAAIPVG